MTVQCPRARINRVTLQSVFANMQKVVKHEDSMLVKRATNAVEVMQQRLQDLELLLGTDRMKAVVTRLSNAGSSKDGSVYATRLSMYENKVTL